MLDYVIRLHLVCGVSKIITQKAVMVFDGAVSQQSVGRETTERRYINKILKNAKLLNDGCHGSK